MKPTTKQKGGIPKHRIEKKGCPNLEAIAWKGLYRCLRDLNREVHERCSIFAMQARGRLTGLFTDGAPEENAGKIILHFYSEKAGGRLFWQNLPDGFYIFNETLAPVLEVMADATPKELAQIGIKRLPEWFWNL